jgi:hypothetical protein
MPLKRSRHFLLGRTFGRLTVISSGTPVPRKGFSYLCRCSCGRYMTATTAHLVTGQTKSCGCLLREWYERTATTHGAARRNRADDRLRIIYDCWRGTKRRCFAQKSKNWEHYGKRGIFCCSSWSHSFPIFLADVGAGWRKGLSLDRIDNNDGYHPGNVQWSDQAAQLENRRPNGSGATETVCPF